MESERIHVRHVHGRYPHPALLRSENISARVAEDRNLLLIRLDDERYPDFWMELTLEVSEQDRSDLPW